METDALLAPKHVSTTEFVPYSRQALLKEAGAIWRMAWKVSLATFCRISLSTISTAFLGHIGSKELAASALAGIWAGGVQIFIYGFAVSLCTVSAFFSFFSLY